MIRLDKYLADMQVGTRSQVKEYVRKRKVTVNGNIVTSPDYKLDENSDEVCFNGERVGYVEYEYYMLNKPAGVLSATMDKKAKTVVDLIPSARKDLFPVGRLDKDTEGLLLITNDGQLAHELLSPKKHVGKTYLAHITGQLPANATELFEEGLKVDDEFTAMPAQLSVLGTPDSDNEYSGKAMVDEKRMAGEQVTTVHITIREGKFHQVKRMFQAVGCEVIYLKRLQMGPLILGENLQVGEYRLLSEAEVNALKTIKGDSNE
ncbi:MAG: rRNA pseudouridine synthase [Lachnospira sp.]|nr:rRNA pseudouridine synthase [Lachnospira sp.]